MLIEGPGFELAGAPIPAHLRRFIDSWLGYRELSALPVERVEHPTGRAVLILEFGDPIEVGALSGPLRRCKSGFFAGIDEAPSLTRFSGEQAGIEVNLSPEGAFALLGGGLAEIRGEVVETVELRMTSTLSPRLRDAETWEERFRLVEDEFWRRVEGASPLSPFVRQALRLIDADDGALRVNQLSRTLGVSRKHLHERFLAETGFSPKRYSSLRRFARVKDLLSAGSYGSLASISNRIGYADQAHFTREVRQFAGVTPRQLAFDLQKPIAVEVQQLKRVGDGSFPAPG